MLIFLFLEIRAPVGPKQISKAKAKKKNKLSKAGPKLHAPSPSPGASLFQEYPGLSHAHCQLEGLSQWLKGELIETLVPVQRATLPCAAFTVCPQLRLLTHYQAVEMT